MKKTILTLIAGTLLSTAGYSVEKEINWHYRSPSSQSSERLFGYALRQCEAVIDKTIEETKNTLKIDVSRGPMSYRDFMITSTKTKHDPWTGVGHFEAKGSIVCVYDVN